MMRWASFALLLVALGFSACNTVPKLPPNPPLTVAGYKSAMEDRLGPIWYRAVRADHRVTVGTVKLIFDFPATGGRVQNIKVISNTGGSVDEMVARLAVDRLRVPALPAELLQALGKDHLACEESFTIFQNPDSSPPPKR